MSRIGRLPISLPSGVDLKIDGPKVLVTGPKGQLSLDLVKGVSLKVTDNQLVVSVATPEMSKFHGLTRALLANMIFGVSQGWTRILELSGTGFRAAVDGSNLNLALGFSHPVTVPAPTGIKFEVQENKITVSGVDKILVGETAARIRLLKKADPYKAKGFKYQGEVIIRKAGKAAKTTAG